MCSKKINLHFIPNTHLDREWTIDFQHTRKLTVEFIDALIEIMRKVPQYAFLLDSQVVPLEDYLEIRPENKGIIKKFVKEGRLNIGPWYTAPDMNCLLGESVVRNLLYGHKIGKEYGGVMKIGYTPFGFVHISQLPQIYKGFDIDVCYFYRGINHEEAPKAEFLWESPDGTVILASRMSKKPRYNFYFDVWRQAYYKGMEYRLKRRYNWYDGQMPFKLCNEEYRFDQGAILKPSRKLDEETLKLCFRELIETEKKNFMTSEIAFMHGMDSSMPDIREDEVLHLCQKYLAPNERFFYSSLPYYTACLKRRLRGKKLKKFKGEMISPGDKVAANLRLTFVNIVSTRVRQKMLTAKAEALLERFAEPFATITYLLLGKREWPAEYFDLAWKYFLKCTPHDTIGGCGIDRIEEDAAYRLNQSISLSKAILKESLGKIQSIVDMHNFGKEDIVITVFNPSPFARSEVVSSYIDIPQEINMGDFAVYDVENEEAVECIKEPTGNIGKIFRDKTDLALFCETREYKVSFAADNVPPMGYKTFVVKKSFNNTAPTCSRNTLSPHYNVMENEFIKVKINANGTVDILNKESNFWYRGMNYFEDAGEAGHPWTHFPPEKDEIITSLDAKAKIKMLENNGLLSCYEAYIKLMVPETTLYDEKKRVYNPCPEGAVRSKKKKPIDIHLYYVLKKGAKSLEVQAKIINTCENHRLRVMFPTKLPKANHSYAETPYDVVERVIVRDKKHPFYGIQNPDYAFLRFVAVSDNKNGFAFISNGLHEYQVSEDKDRILAVTLIRAVELRLCTTALWDKVESKSKLSQSLGEHEFCYYLYPYVGKWSSSDIYNEVERLSYPLVVCQSGAAIIEERAGDVLPTSCSFFSIDGKNVILSALKKSEYDSSVILRLFNPSDKVAHGKIQFFKKIKSVLYVNMNEEITKRQKKINFSGNAFLINIPPKKIITLSVAL